MYRWLEKNQKQKSKLIACYDFVEDYNLNRQSFESGEFNFIAPDHCGIEYQNRWVDSDWFIQEVMYSITQTIDEEKMLFLINLGNHWSKKFDRIQTKRISKRLEINLSDVFI